MQEENTLITLDAPI